MPKNELVLDFVVQVETTKGNNWKVKIFERGPGSFSQYPRIVGVKRSDSEIASVVADYVSKRLAILAPGI